MLSNSFAAITVSAAFAEYQAELAADKAAAIQAEIEAAETESRRASQAWVLGLFGRGDTAWVNEDGTLEVWGAEFTDADVDHWVARGYDRAVIERLRLGCDDYGLYWQKHRCLEIESGLS